MGIESSGEIQICPYWRKYVAFNGGVLALCGAVAKEEILQDNDDKPLYPKLKRF